jgi:hypothetical protein
LQLLILFCIIVAVQRTACPFTDFLDQHEPGTTHEKETKAIDVTFDQACA